MVAKGDDPISFPLTIFGLFLRGNRFGTLPPSQREAKNVVPWVQSTWPQKTVKDVEGWWFLFETEDLFYPICVPFFLDGELKINLEGSTQVRICFCWCFLTDSILWDDKSPFFTTIWGMFLELVVQTKIEAWSLHSSPLISSPLGLFLHGCCYTSPPLEMKSDGVLFFLSCT